MSDPQRFVSIRIINFVVVFFRFGVVMMPMHFVLPIVLPEYSHHTPNDGQR